jgi:hypothetical protein
MLQIVEASDAAEKLYSMSREAPASVLFEVPAHPLAGVAGALTPDLLLTPEEPGEHPWEPVADRHPTTKADCGSDQVVARFTDPLAAETIQSPLV